MNEKAKKKKKKGKKKMCCDLIRSQFADLIPDEQKDQKKKEVL